MCMGPSCHKTTYQRVCCIMLYEYISQGMPTVFMAVCSLSCNLHLTAFNKETRKLIIFLKRSKESTSCMYALNLYTTYASTQRCLQHLYLCLFCTATKMLAVEFLASSWSTFFQSITKKKKSKQFKITIMFSYISRKAYIRLHRRVSKKFAPA